MAEAGRALHLIYVNDEGKFELGEEAVAALNAVKGPVGVCTVCGRARQGKSFILNKLAASNTGEGFVVGPTHRPCTKGIWIWSAPLERTARDGSTYHVILLDTEGIDAYDQTGQYSIQIFSLAVLLSSLFVYNQMGGIDEAALDRLSLVTEMSKHIAVQADSFENTNQEEIGKFSPSFIWLLRDFYLNLEEDGRVVTPLSYLETALSNMVGSGAAVESKNSIRESIRALFPERECFTLVRPVNDEELLQQLNTVPMDQLRPKFVEGLTSLISMINNRCMPKKVGGDVLNGPALASMAAAYIGAINNGAVPAIATAWENVATSECSRIVNDVESAVYVAEFETAAESCPPEDLPLMAAHAEALKKAVAVFESQAVGSRTVRDQHIAMLEERTSQRFHEYKTNRFSEASAKTNELAGSLLDEITRSCEQHPDTPLASGFGCLDDGLEQFTEQACGPDKFDVLRGLMKRALAGPLKNAHGSESNAAEQREEKLRTEGAEALAACELQLEQAKTTAANEATAAAQREAELSQKAADELAASEKATHEAQQAAAKEMADTQQAAHEQQVDSAAQLASAEKEAMARQQEAAEKLALLEQEKANELSAAEKRLLELQGAMDLKISDMEATHQAALGNAEMQHQQAIAEGNVALAEAEKKALAEHNAMEKKAMELTNDYENQLRDVKDELSEATKRSDKLEEELAASVAKGESLEAELAASVAKGEGLEAELAASVANGEGLEAELAASVANGESLEAELADTQQQSVEAADAAKCQKQADEADNVAAMSALESQLEQVGVHNTALTTELAALQQTAGADSARTSQELTDTRAQVKTLEADLVDSKQTTESISSERAQLAASRDKAVESLQAAHKKQSELEDQITDLERKSAQREDEFGRNMSAMGMKFKQYQEEADEKNTRLAMQLQQQSALKPTQGVRSRLKGFFWSENNTKADELAEDTKLEKSDAMVSAFDGAASEQSVGETSIL